MSDLTDRLFRKAELKAMHDAFNCDETTCIYCLESFNKAEIEALEKMLKTCGQPLQLAEV